MPHGAEPFGSKVCASPDRQEQTLVGYDTREKKFKIGRRCPPSRKDDQPLTLRVSYRQISRRGVCQSPSCGHATYLPKSERKHRKWRLFRKVVRYGYSASKRGRWYFLILIDGAKSRSNHFKSRKLVPKSPQVTSRALKRICQPRSWSSLNLSGRSHPRPRPVPG